MRKNSCQFDKDDPFKELGIRKATASDGGGRAGLDVNDVVLAKIEFSGLSGMQQMIKENKAVAGGSSNDAD